MKLTERHEKAASLVAEGELTSAAICAQVGISTRTLLRWKDVPEFSDRVGAILDEYRRAVRLRGIAIRERRIDALNDRWTRMQQILRERAEDPDVAGVPGGTTGLVVKLTSASPTEGASPQVAGYAVDTALLKELREHEKQAAQELGQWVEQQSVAQVAKAYVTVGPDDL